MISIPFLGSKRNYLKQVEQIVKDGRYKTVFEPFGGSAVLSVNLFNDGIIERAVINDYDHLFDIYPAYLDLKDEIIAKCLEFGITKNKSGKMLPVKQRSFLQNLISEVDEKYWPLLANNFAFSAKAASGLRLSDFSYFLNDLSTDKQRKYLDIVSHLDRVSMDYSEFFEKFQDDFTHDSILLLDPPYLNSSQKHYSNKKCFSLSETIDVLNLTKQAGSDFIFFNMIEKDTESLLELYNFKEIIVETRDIRMNHNTSREDVMAYVRQNKPAFEQAKFSI